MESRVYCSAFVYYYFGLGRSTRLLVWQCNLTRYRTEYWVTSAQLHPFSSTAKKLTALFSLWSQSSLAIILSIPYAPTELRLSESIRNKKVASSNTCGFALAIAVPWLSCGGTLSADDVLSRVLIMRRVRKGWFEIWSGLRRQTRNTNMRIIGIDAAIIVTAHSALLHITMFTRATGSGQSCSWVVGWITQLTSTVLAAKPEHTNTFSCSSSGGTDILLVVEKVRLSPMDSQYTKSQGNPNSDFLTCSHREFPNYHPSKNTEGQIDYSREGWLRRLVMPQAVGE